MSSLNPTCRNLGERERRGENEKRGEEDEMKGADGEEGAESFSNSYSVALFAIIDGSQC